MILYEIVVTVLLNNVYSKKKKSLYNFGKSMHLGKNVTKSFNGKNLQQKINLMIVQFRPYCQVWRQGPLDLTVS